MAITIAHPALAVPFRRLGLPLSPLVIGSMVPDFEFFLKMSPDRSISHSLLGIPVFCFPVGLLCVLLFDRFLKDPLLSLLPDHHQAGFSHLSDRFGFFPVSRFLKVCVALIIGILTHLTWDLFTHGDGVSLQLMPFLAAPLLTIKGHTVPVHFALQHVTSIIGIGWLIFAYRKKISRTLPMGRKVRLQRPRLARPACITFIGGYGFLGGLTHGASHLPGIDSIKALEGFIAHTVVGSVSSGALVLCGFAIFYHLTRRRVISGDAE